MKYSWLTLGRIEAIVNKLGGTKEAVKFFLSDKVKLVRVFDTWRTIQIGLPREGFSGKDDFFRLFEEQEMPCYSSAKQAIASEDFTMHRARHDIELVMVTPAELGMKRFLSGDTLWQYAREHGLDLCPQEVGPWLRLQYTDQPEDEQLYIAMKPLCCGVTGSGVFALYNLSRCSQDIRIQDFSAVYDRPLDSKWIFVRHTRERAFE